MNLLITGFPFAELEGFQKAVVNAVADVAMSPVRHVGRMVISRQAQGAALLGRAENWEAGKGVKTSIRRCPRNGGGVFKGLAEATGKEPERPPGKASDQSREGRLLSPETSLSKKV